MDALYTVELFGGLRVVCRDGTGRAPITRFRTQKTGLLLAYLAHHNKRRHTREPLVEMLWPDTPIEQGRQGLSMALSSLRAQLEPPDSGILPGTVLLADRATVGVSAAIATDTARFETLLDALLRETKEEVSALQLTEAARLYHNQLLPGFYDGWIVPEQERLHDRWRRVQEWLSRHAKPNGPLAEALAHARQVSHSTLDAAATDKEPRTRKTRGGRAGSTRFATAFQQTPADPSPLHGPSPLFASPLICEPVLPPLVIPLTRFFGRETELRRLADWVADPTVRLVTLTGPGGAGKTRLAREAARRLRDTEAPPDSRTPRPTVFVADLSALTEADRLDGTLTTALGLPANPAVSALEGVVGMLNAVPAPILVLDNMEQLLPGGAPWLEILLAHIPALTCLVTSRCLLHIEGEHELPTEPLAHPRRLAIAMGRDEEPDGPMALLRDWPGIALFVDRAQLARPDFALTRRNAHDIVQLVACLEGVPLALELAAARAQVLSPAQILDYLQRDGLDALIHRGRKLLARHRSLRETIAWSHGLLSPDLQQAFARLSVFRGGWSVAAAEAVTYSPIVLDMLAQLCDASLVQAHTEANGGVRFTMLETIRLFAQEQLSIQDRVDAEESHALHFREMAQQAAPDLEKGDPGLWLNRLEADQENLYAALGWYEQESTGEKACAGLQFASDLYRFWMVRGNLPEGRRRLQQMVERVPERADAAADEIVARATALNRVGVLAMRQRDHEGARYWLEAARAVRERLDDASGMAATLNKLAIVESELSNFPEAARYYEESLKLWRQLGNERNAFIVLDNLGALSLDAGDSLSAYSLFAESLGGAERLGDFHSILIRRRNLGEALYRQGRWAEAIQCFWQSLRDAHDMKETRGCASCLHNLAFVFAAQGQTEHAAHLREAALAFYKAHTLSLSTFARVEEARLFCQPQQVIQSRSPSSFLSWCGVNQGEEAAYQEQASLLVRLHTEEVLHDKEMMRVGNRTLSIPFSTLAV